jgi:hypothetical protein
METGRGGSDRFTGGRGAETAESLDSGNEQPDDVRCDSRDAAVESDAADRLGGCSIVRGWSPGELKLWVQPELAADRATFTLRCSYAEFGAPGPYFKRCRG